MKKYSSFLIAVWLLAICCSSCKKENAATPAAAVKDYSVAVKDRTWWGRLTNAGEIAQPYSVHFNTDNTATWSQLSGDYTGHWSLDKNKLTLNFSAPVGVVTADITDDNKPANAVGTSAKINSVASVENPYTALDNTVWRGDIGNPSQTLQLHFTPAAGVDLNVGGAGFGKVTYTRSAAGGCVRFTNSGNDFFGVITSEHQLTGIVGFFDSLGLWQATK